MAKCSSCGGECYRRVPRHEPIEWTPIELGPNDRVILEEQKRSRNALDDFFGAWTRAGLALAHLR